MKKWLMILFQLLLSGYAFPKETDKYYTEIITCGGDRYAGKILYATDSLLILWQSEEPFSSEKMNEFVKPLYYFDLERVIIKREGQLGRGLKYGVLIGGSASALILLCPSDEPYSGVGKAFGVGVVLPSSLIIGGVWGAAKGIDYDFVINGKRNLYEKTQPLLTKNALYPLTPPPELQKVVEQKKKQLPSPLKELKPPAPITKRPASPWYSRLHFSSGIGIANTRDDDDILDAFRSSGFGGQKFYNEGYESRFSLNFGAEYNLNDRLRLGIEWSDIIGYVIEGGWEESWVHESADRRSISLYLDYIAVPLDPLFLRHFEVALGTGLSYNYLSLQVNDEFSLHPMEVQKDVLGAYMKASVDYYLVKNLSFQFKVEGRLIPSISVPERNYGNEKLVKHRVNFSDVDFSLLLGLHF